MINNAIEVEDLHVVRGTAHVLPGLSLTVPRGSITGLLGPSGCGKTTLIRAIAGIQVVRSGTVTVLGEPAGAPANRARVGYVTQASSVYPDLTVRQNLAYFADLSGVGRDAAEAAMRQVGLDSQADTLTGSLSGGQRTRVSLAAALLTDCELLLLDEPTVGLDPVLRRDLWNLFRRLADGGTTLLVSSHVMDEAARCDLVLLLREGRLLSRATPDELRSAAGTDDLEEAFLLLAERSAA
ncbi:ABC transporter, ATP-binding protein [Aeromicrobium marinum DSM 15272]|uniref:ABC transporter, ATP-binding protein n=1 Tax=Aeromicrobium marinum DSM 15272 TaxID=585531 RepID=E2SFS8_9ACTN|nr:ABC transporter ATP-binding protein [Aeromicrobium marinum]EFQ81980.1 ABC transporter, ATP-binding protein [Aeromicrobium marinum DSM 15272]